MYAYFSFAAKIEHEIPLPMLDPIGFHLSR